VISSFRRTNINPAVSLAPLVSSICLLAAGCSTVATGTWQTPRTENAPYKNILVVAAIPYEEMRRDLEDLLSTEISAGGSNAASSRSIEHKQPHEPKSPESIITMIGETGADSLLVLRIIDQSVKLGKTPDKGYVNIGPQIGVIEDANVTEVWASDYSIGQTQGQMVAKSDSKMEAILYDVKDKGRAVYTIEIETKYEENGGDSTYVIAGNIATAVNNKLRQAGLIL